MTFHFLQTANICNYTTLQLRHCLDGDPSPSLCYLPRDFYFRKHGAKKAAADKENFDNNAY